METTIAKLTQQNTSLANANMQVNFEPPQFLEVELDQAENIEALRTAREQKFFKTQRTAYNQRLNQKEVYVTRTAEDLYQSLVDAGFKFADAMHQVKVKQLCCYFASDERFNGNLHKGILLVGNIGNGKTSLMKYFACNQNHSYRVESMMDVAADYKSHGEAGVKAYNANFTTTPNVYGKKEHGYCFDDLGVEETPARHYGESKNVFAEIIQIRYFNQGLLPFNSTHATTNKTENELLTLYGTRAYDRMKEMFNVVVFENGSFR